MKKLHNSIEATIEQLNNDDSPWIVGFSGGKDSSLVIQILISAFCQLPVSKRKKLYVFYCDTGVEIPVLKDYIKNTLERIRKEGRALGVDISVKAIKPAVKDRYFVKVIGRGYPPPTNIFRWCTDRLRIDPIQVAIKQYVGDGEATVILGTRFSESGERDKILKANALDKPYLFKQQGHQKTTLFCPIVDFTAEDVWEGLLCIKGVSAIDLHLISKIYKEISGECPIIRLPETNPCSKGRFGCWTCTVVRKDKASKNLILNGYKSLEPLYEFREWLLSIRDEIEFRCTVRRNGQGGLGPFRLSARVKILEMLIAAQEASGHNLISDAELSEIYRLWQLDKDNSNYAEDLNKHLANQSTRTQQSCAGV
ncbi:phosphoadenosine phosphosulfate reductase family protein [Sedimenticola thiotaurini]|uniref:phosphoadenosine phosphosulfate reductase domain-containing protein n=1 Tax=Sedimenticola thiotaurini TaxID=1543721 RepID=UPI00069B1BB2|nr:phosphoadenosine phosphosulfate reductase family protein [Sedimenticola thiotaurini]